MGPRADLTLQWRIMSTGYVDRDDPHGRNTSGSPTLSRLLQHLNAPRRILSTGTRRIDTRWLRATLWGLGVISFVITMTRALDIGLSTYEVDFDVYLMGAKHVFTGHLTRRTWLPRKSPSRIRRSRRCCSSPSLQYPEPPARPYGQVYR